MENKSGKKGSIAERKEMFDRGVLPKELVKGLVDESAMNAIRAFRNSPTMEAILAFQDTPAMRSIHAFQSSPAMRAIRAFQSLSSMRLTELLPKNSQISAHLQQLGSFAYSIDDFRQAAQALEKTQASPLAEFLASEHSADIPDLVEASGDATMSVVASGDFRVATAAQLELERQIVGHFEQGKPATALSGEQKSRLQVIVYLIVLIMAFLDHESTVRQELCFFQPKLAPSMTSRQVGKAVRNFMCEREFPAEMLLRIRTVKGEGVKLRAGPGMKEEVLPVVLQDRALLEVLDSENRDWLHVAVLGDEGVDGWISRKHTHRSTQ